MNYCEYHGPVSTAMKISELSQQLDKCISASEITLKTENTSAQEISYRQHCSDFALKHYDPVKLPSYDEYAKVQK
jgi:hypothetical protein